MSSKPNSKRAKALASIEHAVGACAKALSLLGGRTKYKHRLVPPPPEYIARQYLESIASRLAVVQRLLIEPITLSGSKSLSFIENAFEKEYERTRDSSLLD